jgi:predicted  nucleic acid-binding Zn-ribbon protein
MIPRELLDQLRGLNRAVRESKRAGLSEQQHEQCEARIAELRAKLPTALLTQHDRITRAGNDSVAAVSGSCCGSCHMKLPVGLLADLGQPGRIAVCPHCGVFVFKEAGTVARAGG